MGNLRTECNKWAEEIYWGHFQHIHFSQFLHSDFDKQLALPKKFSDNLRKKLPDSVTLKGPGGGTWTVGVTTVDDVLFFKHGWQEFVSDHPLEENDFLVFRYNGDSHFEVLMFDGKSLCEKEISYFVKKCEVVKQDHESCLNKIKLLEATSKEINNASSVNVGCTSLEKSRDDNCIVTHSREQIVTPMPDRKTRQKLPAIRPRRGRGSASKGSSSSSRDLQVASNSNATHTPTRRTGYGMQYASNRRTVSEDEKAAALQLAQAAASKSGNEALLVIMKPSHVFKRFYVLLPLDWVSKFITLENQDLYLRVGEKEWRTRFNYNRLRGSTGVTSGWKHFAVDNSLDRFDVCLLEPGSPVNNSLCLDVQIFRVVPEVTPLTLVATPKSGKRKKKEEDEEEEDEEEKDTEDEVEEEEIQIM